MLPSLPSRVPSKGLSCIRGVGERKDQHFSIPLSLRHKRQRWAAGQLSHRSRASGNGRATTRDQCPITENGNSVRPDEFFTRTRIRNSETRSVFRKLIAKQRAGRSSWGGDMARWSTISQTPSFDVSSDN